MGTDYTVRQLATLLGPMVAAPGAAARRERRTALPCLIFLVAGLRSLAVERTKLTGEAPRL